MNPHIESYLAEVKRLNSLSTFTQYQNRLSKFAEHVGPKFHDWDRKTAMAYLFKLQKEGMTESSVFQVQQHLSSFYSWLAHESIIAFNPLREGKKFKHQFKSERKAFTETEYQSILARASQEGKMEWRDAIMTAWETGLRMGDVALLEWREIDEAKLAIRCRPNKTLKHGVEVEIPIREEFLNALLKRRNGAPHVFPRLSAEYRQQQHKSLSAAFGKLCKRAGVSGKSFHSLRHSFVTRMLAAGVPAPMLSTMTGQSLRIIMDYCHITLDDKRETMRKLLT